MSIVTMIFIINIIVLVSLTNWMFSVMKGIKKDKPEVVENNRFKRVECIINFHAAISVASVPAWIIYMVATS